MSNKQEKKKERGDKEPTKTTNTKTTPKAPTTTTQPRRRRRRRNYRHTKPFGRVFFALLFVVGYLTWQNIQVSIQLPTDNNNADESPGTTIAAALHRSMDKSRGRRRGDAADKKFWIQNLTFVSKHIQEHHTGSSSSNHNQNNHNSDSTTKTIPSFPRWADPTGISWKAMEEYIRWADQDLDHSRDLLDCPPGVICVHDAPNVLYIFGGASSRHDHPGVSTTNATTTTTTPPRVYVEQRRRKLVGPGFAKRYPIVEELMHRSLDYLHTTSTNNNNATTTTKNNNDFPRLRRLLFSGSVAGIPLILNLGDNQQCFHHNLKAAGDNNSYLSVPVFTLAVPVDCHYAFPMPHPAALDTAKVYGHDWASIQRRRATQYPFSKQQRQAVWRGSPTGNQKARQRLVYHANTPPKDIMAAGSSTAADETNTTTTNTSTSSTIFDVGFGKHYHKIVPSYHGPMIRRKDKLFFEDFGKYAVVLDVDGSSWSERFPSLVCLRSVIAKIRPHYVDWLWPTLQASRHYINIDVFDDINMEHDKEDQTSNTTTRRLWSLVAALLQNETQRQEILHETNQWCDAHMVYSQMIHDFLTSLEFYIEQLDKGDDSNHNQHHHTSTTSWYEQWAHLLQYDMPPEHHHWQALPVEEAKPYFGLWRDL